MIRSILLCLLLLPSLFVLNAQTARRLDPHLNSEYEEREPILSPDGNYLYFWRRENPDNVAGALDPGDIWYSRRDRDGNWMTAQHLPTPVNTYGHDFVWGVSADNDTLWLNQVPPGVKDNGLRFTVKTRDGYWQAPQKASIRGFEYQGLYKDYFMGPGRVMLLPHEGKDSYGGTDIYVCFPISATEWGQPVNLGPVLNSPGDDDAPFLTPDGKALYFNSNGHGGYGDHDVFVSYRLDNSWRNWSPPENLGAPVSTRGYDFDFILSQDGKEAYWGSDYQSTGSNDIFFMEMGICEVDLYPENDHTLCEGDIFMMEAGFQPGRDIEYRWLKDGREIPGALTRKLRVRASGDYQVVRIQGSCRATSPVKRLRFVPPPEALIDKPADVICLDDSLRLYAPSATATAFQWQKNGLDIPNAIVDAYWVKTPGEYSVRVYRGECIQSSVPVNLQRMTPPMIFSGNDSLGGILPVFPRWLWTNKIPYQKGGETYMRDVVANAKGEAYVMHTLEKRGRYYDQISGFFANGLFRTSFPEERRETADQCFMAADPEGNLIVASAESYLKKYHPDGRVAWELKEEIPELSGVTTDPLGNIYTLGRFKEQLQIGKRVLGAPRRGGLFIAKHNPFGDPLWIRVFPVDGSRYQFGNAIHTDCEGNVYIAGGMDLIANFKVQVVRASLREESYFVAKFNPEGQLIWARQATSPKTRTHTLDVSTDCDGSTFLALNRVLHRFDAQGNHLWQGKLLGPEDGFVQQTRIQALDGDLYINGFDTNGKNFVTKLNRLNRQIILWQDKGAHTTEKDLPAITAMEDQLFVAGMSSGKDFQGVQFDLTSKSMGYLMKYAPPEYVVEREPVEICGGNSVNLYTQNRKGLNYQWYRNGKPLRNSNSYLLVTDQAGTYEVEAGSGSCMQRSKPQQVIGCGDDPITSPTKTAPPLASKQPQSPNLSPPPKTETVVAPDPLPAAVPAEPTELATNNRGVPTRLRNRRILEQEEMVISSTEATLYIWDHAAVDNDTVSVNVNGEWVVQHYKLEKRKQAIPIKLKPGANFIMLYAINLGAQPPNTASMSIDDGIRTQSLQLRSNLRQCGMLRVYVE